MSSLIYLVLVSTSLVYRCSFSTSLKRIRKEIYRLVHTFMLKYSIIDAKLGTFLIFQQTLLLYLCVYTGGSVGGALNAQKAFVQTVCRFCKAPKETINFFPTKDQHEFMTCFVLEKEISMETSIYNIDMFCPFM